MSLDTPVYTSVYTSLQVDTFPYKYKFIKESPRVLFRELCTNTFLIKATYSYKFRYPIQMMSEEECYIKANVITDLYTEKPRMKAKLKGVHSPFEYWTNYERFIRKQSLLRFGNQTTESLRETIYFTCKEATAFSPVLSKCVYDHLLPKRGGNVLDPFSGWGDRAIGALASRRVLKYTGVDCNEGLFEGYNNIKKDLDNTDKIEFNLSKFEDFASRENKGTEERGTEERGEKYDLIFTSPPFFDFEVYSPSEDQSISGKTGYVHWFNTWMAPVLFQMSKMLATDGLIALHIGSTYRTPTFHVDIYNYLTTVCNLLYVQQIQCLVRNKKAVPIWIYKKFSP